MIKIGDKVINNPYFEKQLIRRYKELEGKTNLKKMEEVEKFNIEVMFGEIKD